MALSSEDFQKVAVSLDDVAKALRDNTTALLRGGMAPSVSSPGASFGAGIAPVGSGAGTGPSGGGGGVGGGPEDAASKGLNLSTMGRLLTASSPATGSLGSSLGSLLGATTPMGLASAAGGLVGLVGKSVSETSHMLKSFTNSDAQNTAAGVSAGIAAAGAGETLGQAKMRSAAAVDIEDKKQNAERYTKMAGGLEGTFLGETEAGKKLQTRYRAQAAEAADSVERAVRHTQDELDPEKRARADVEQKFGRAIHFGAMETEAGKATAEKLYRFFLHREQQAQHGERELDKIIDHVRAGGGGARPGQAGGTANR